VLAQADVLSLHCPLTDGTRNLIGSAELQHMKPTAILVNAARGGIVDEQALADSLRAGRIAGAVVDVLSEEPPRNGNPLLALAAHPGLMLTPHVAWASQQAMALLAEEVVRNIEAYQCGESRNRIV
jgi:glycerate dehydrogenase